MKTIRIERGTRLRSVATGTLRVIDKIRPEINDNGEPTKLIEYTNFDTNEGHLRDVKQIIMLIESGLYKVENEPSN